jgi:hypothetical protein
VIEEEKAKVECIEDLGYHERYSEEMREAINRSLQMDIPS